MAELEETPTQRLLNDWQDTSSRRASKGGCPYPSFYTTIFTIIVSVSFTAILLWPLKRCDPGIHIGELDAPKFPTIQRHLTGGLKYDDAGKLYRDTSEEVRSYVGNSSEVHDAWTMFDAVQTVQLRPEDVSIAGLYVDHRPMAITILDVFHQLHCLNQIRLALYDGANFTDQDSKRRMHVDHCIDYIRQTIECRSDLTPLKLYYSKPAGRMMVDFEGDRTCKDFDAVQDWAWHNRATEIVMQ